MLADLLFRIRALFRRSTVERELDEELRFHLEHQHRQYEQRGLAGEEAQREARLQFGGFEQVKEECRQARGVSLIETSIQDVRYALRAWRRSPSFATVAVLSLALGIGANTAIFSLMKAVLLRMLPVERPEELERVVGNLSYPMFRDLRQRNQVFSGLMRCRQRRSAWSPLAIPSGAPPSWSPEIIFWCSAFSPSWAASSPMPTTACRWAIRWPCSAFAIGGRNWPPIQPSSVRRSVSMTIRSG